MRQSPTPQTCSLLPPRGDRAKPNAPERTTTVFALVLLCLASIVSPGCAARRESLVRGGELDEASAGGAPREVLRFPGSVGDDSEPVGPLHSLVELTQGDLWSAWNSLRGDAYALDGVERFLEDGERPVCAPQSMVRHAGTHLRYQSSVQINPAFRERLERFERVVSEVAVEIYGRAPSRLQHFGAYSCRSSRRRSYRLSEHALGNAIDVTGFDFPRAPRGEALPPGLPAGLRRGFQVRVARHWLGDPDDPTAAAHARFLRELSARLTERHDVFRVMIGPSRRDHADHFHFDMSPWRYVSF
jgi:Extensin-like protein C-terminus